MTRNRAARRQHRPPALPQGLAQFAVLFAFWLMLSDQRSPLFLVLGATAAAAVTLVTQPIVATALVSDSAAAGPGSLRRAVWFGYFVVWLLVRIVAASVQVAYFALNPRLPFEPTFVRFRTTMRRPLSRVILAVAITVVPGTLTVHLRDDEFLVHAALPKSADDLASGRMQNLIGRFLGEQPEAPPELEWLPVEEPVP
jgi:multicomponent Na+:H+ antiporter subunit E